MKMKKLLSIGALGLVLASSISVGASAAERPSNETIANQVVDKVLSGKTPINYNVNVNTTVGNIADIESVTQQLKGSNMYEYLGVAGHYENLKAVLKAINSDATVKTNIENIYMNNTDKMHLLLNDIKDLANELKDIENTDNSKKIEIETEIKDILENNVDGIKVSFGKNIDGKITISIMNNSGKIIVQLNSGNAYTLSNALEDEEFVSQVKGHVIAQLFAK